MFLKLLNALSLLLKKEKFVQKHLTLTSQECIKLFSKTEQKAEIIHLWTNYIFQNGYWKIWTDTEDSKIIFISFPKMIQWTPGEREIIRTLFRGMTFCDSWIWLRSLCEAPCLVLQPEAHSGLLGKEEGDNKVALYQGLPPFQPRALVTELTVHLVHASGKSKSSRGRWKLCRPSWGAKPVRGPARSKKAHDPRHLVPLHSPPPPAKAPSSSPST